MGLNDNAPAALVAEYARAARALFPRGLAWAETIDSNLRKLLLSQGDTWARVDRRAQDLLLEADPRSTVELLPDWERVLGLPAPCSVLASSSTLRRAAVVAKLTGNFGQSLEAFRELAASLGWDSSTITITEARPFRVGISGAGEALQGEAWAFAWTVTAPTFTPEFARSGISSAGDPLVDGDNDLLRCFLEELKPAHTVVLVNFTEPFTGYAPWTDLEASAAVLDLAGPSPLLT